MAKSFDLVNPKISANQEKPVKGYSRNTFAAVNLVRRPLT